MLHQSDICVALLLICLFFKPQGLFPICTYVAPMCHLCVTGMAPFLIILFEGHIRYILLNRVIHFPIGTYVAPKCHLCVTGMAPFLIILFEGHIKYILLNRVIHFPLGTYVAPKCHLCVTGMAPLLVTIFKATSNIFS